MIFPFLVTDPNVRDSRMFAIIYFLFLKLCLGSNLKAFNTKFGPQWKDQKSSCQVKRILTPFFKLVAPSLFWNCVNWLRVTKFFKQVKFEVVWSISEGGNRFRRLSWTKYWRQTLVFMWNGTLQEKFNFYFLRAFCWNEDWPLGSNSLKFWDFFVIS